MAAIRWFDQRVDAIFGGGNQGHNVSLKFPKELHLQLGPSSVADPGLKMNVKERARLFQDLGETRSRNQVLDVSGDASPEEDRPKLPERPLNKALGEEAFESRPPLPSRPHSTSELLGKKRPPLPPKTRSSSVLLKHGRGTGRPRKITLIDLEEEEREGGAAANLSDSGDVESSDPESDGDPSARDAVSITMGEAKKRTLLISQSVLRDAKILTETGLSRSKPTAELILQNAILSKDKVQQGIERIKSDTVNTLDSSGASMAFNNATQAAQTGLNEAKSGAINVLGKVGVLEAFAKTRDDLSDIASRSAGQPGLCSKCKSLPVNACFPEASEVTTTEMQWTTPLLRVVYHATWCRMCMLLLSMLCREEFDPLNHPEVAAYIQPELKDLSMSQWVAKGWDFADKNWPFGRNEKRHEGAGYFLVSGGTGVAKTSITTFRKVARVVALGSTIGSPQGRRRYEPPSAAQRYRQGLQRGREEKTRYPASCVIQILLNTHVNIECPGALTVNLVGYGNRPEGTAQNLSQFRLRVVNDNVTGNPRIGKPLSYGRRLNSAWIDVSIGKSWICECETRHGTKCSEHGWALAMRKPGFLRVIDIENYCVVEADDPATCRFIALSYVWGGAKTIKLKNNNLAGLMQKGGLKKYFSVLPRTILDAMEVVKRLGERYLWVDSLCILQENTKEALEQIASMDRVYGSALLTIVAAEGEDAHAGLRGVRREHILVADRSEGVPRRIVQASAEVRADMSIIAPFVSQQDLGLSAWNSRAWCFQEKLLSRRLLIFAGQEVIWHCPGMVCREDMTVEESGYTHPPLDWLALKPQYLGVDVDQYWIDGSIDTTRYGTTRLVRSGTFNEYAKMLEQYTSRTLSYTSDVLNALAGLLHIFQLCFQSRLTYGLPMVLLDVAILWRPAQRLKRRPRSADGQVFPTWSWAGWIGRVAYDKPLAVKRDALGQLVQLSQEHNEDEVREEGVRPLLRWHTFNVKTSAIEPLNGTGRGIPLDSSSFPREWEARPYIAPEQSSSRIYRTPSLSDLDIKTRLDMGEHHLIFWTSCANSFQLGNAVIQESDKIWTSSANRSSDPQNEVLRFSIVDQSFHWVGTVLLDGDGPDWIHRDKHEFILLSEAQYFGLDDELHDVGEYPNYLVMLVERESASKIATRLGLGRIRKTAWMLADPELRLVCLG